MTVIRRTAQAEEDLIDICLYIAQDNPGAADRLLDEIEEKILLLADQPQLGPARPDIAEEWTIMRRSVLLPCLLPLSQEFSLDLLKGLEVLCESRLRVSHKRQTSLLEKFRKVSPCHLEREAA